MHSSILEVQREGILPRKTQALEMLLPAGIHRLGERGGGKGEGDKGERREQRRKGKEKAEEESRRRRRRRGGGGWKRGGKVNMERGK